MTSQVLTPHVGGIFQGGFGRFLLDHELTIIFVSALICLLFALMILLLHRSSRILHAQKWGLSFAGAFLVVSLLYFFRIFLYGYYGEAAKDLPDEHVSNVIILLGSGLSNYLFFISAFRLMGPASFERLLKEHEKWRAGKNYFKAALLIFLCTVSLTGTIGKGWSQLPDAVFSITALVFMGYMLYQNISYRRDRLMAWVALLSSIGYSVFYLLWRAWGMHYIAEGILPGGSEIEIATAASLLFYLISLIPKFGLFLPAYSFMLILAAPFEGIEPLFKRVTDGDKEFLDNGGLVQSITEEFGFKSAKLDIMLPGSKADHEHSKGGQGGAREESGCIQVATYEYDTSRISGEQGPQISWYKEGTDYDQVMKTGASHVPDRGGYLEVLMRRIERATVPVHFHKKTIACLSAERGEGKFTETDLSELERIATMIAPCVQEYRELAALNKLDQELGQLQIGVEEYALEKNVEDIVGIIHNIVAPAATGLSLEAGFSESFIRHPAGGGLDAPLDARLRAKLEKEDDLDEEGRRWLGMPLQILIETAKVDQPARQQDLGKVIFGAERRSENIEQVAVGTHPAFRRALSDLMTDTLLDFIRGYLNHLTDKLGIQLGSLEGADFGKWWEGVDAHARQAKLLWVVAEVPGSNQLYGEPDAVELVQELKRPDAADGWKVKGEEQGEKFWLCALTKQRAKAWRVVRRSHAGSETTLWFGVGREHFGPELEYVSPWKYFLDHFCQIAFSALFRIQLLKHEETQYKNLAVLKSFMSDTADDYSVIHTMNNCLEEIGDKLDDLDEEVKWGRLHLTPGQENMISTMKKYRLAAEKEFLSIVDDVKRNKRCPFPLDELIAEVWEESKDPAAKFGIELKRPGSSGQMINVPYHIAKTAVKTVVDNAVDALREAIRNQTREFGLVTITVEPNGQKLSCIITDNGPGVLPELRKTLFRDVTRSSKKKSNGFGLYNSRALLCQHDGDISLEPQSPDTGAEFRITFPKAIPARSEGGDVR
jgi:uncharacterized protein YdcH (DUF465 family)